jgi:hypothetical protein
LSHIALLGAGFSRNWGGWLAPEVFGELLGRLGQDREIYSRLRKSGNFEDALAEVQREARANDTPEAIDRLKKFECAVESTFAEMNHVFSALPGWNLSKDVGDSINGFLARFDAIYTLNQDLLLELHYQNDLVDSRKWNGFSYPGMRLPSNWHHLLPHEKLLKTWQPAGDVRLDWNCQPIIKLHGSSNWRDPTGDRLMVMGGGKLQVIDRHPVLSKYLSLFTEQLYSGNAKVMAIGYSFSDSHINELLVKASTQYGLGLHLVNPAGLSVLRPQPDGAIRGPNPLEDIALIGVTVRTLRESFSGDKLSHQALMRFFN